MGNYPAVHFHWLSVGLPSSSTTDDADAILSLYIFAYFSSLETLKHKVRFWARLADIFWIRENIKSNKKEKGLEDFFWQK